MHTKRTASFLLIALTALHSAAKAAIISTTGAILVIPAPPDARTGHLENSASIRAFAEQQNLTLAHPVLVDITVPGTSPAGGVQNLSPGQIATGATVSSFFLHYDQPGAPGVVVEAIGSITFDTDVLGIIVLSQALDDTDTYPGLPTTIYTSGDSLRGMEIFPAGSDVITLSPDRRTIIVDFHNVNNADDVRIITAAVPEPASLLLAGIAIVCLAASAMHRQRRRYH